MSDNRSIPPDFLSPSYCNHRDNRLTPSPSGKLPPASLNSNITQATTIPQGRATVLPANNGTANRGQPPIPATTPYRPLKFLRAQNTLSQVEVKKPSDEIKSHHQVFTLSDDVKLLSRIIRSYLCTAGGYFSSDSPGDVAALIKLINGADRVMPPAIQLPLIECHIGRLIKLKDTTVLKNFQASLNKLKTEAGQPEIKAVLEEIRLRLVSLLKICTILLEDPDPKKYNIKEINECKTVVKDLDTLMKNAVAKADLGEQKSLDVIRDAARRLRAFCSQPLTIPLEKREKDPRTILHTILPELEVLAGLAGPRSPNLPKPPPGGSPLLDE